ncbi:hypothetical protein QBC46DRAFT_356607 [Diplogelasinospora grovesii]|uniref:Uncharacterized protein n=1 Tax=Diplogelasinospora grovesii TaxID=303347 RepID=A0AAN6S2F7_9PEZI|nr:hypothetical protein QBC46DRAFT_356607 [Diplogelasinospora grovesii]
MDGSLPPAAFKQVLSPEYDGIGGAGGVPNSTEWAGHVSGIAPAQNDDNITMLLKAANCVAMPFADTGQSCSSSSGPNIHGSMLAGGSLDGRADHPKPRGTMDDNGRISTDVPFGQSGNPDGSTDNQVHMFAGNNDADLRAGAAITESPNIEDGGPTAPVDSEAGSGSGPADLSCHGQDATVGWGNAQWSSAHFMDCLSPG